MKRPPCPCGRKHHARGLCNRCYSRYLTSGEFEPAPKDEDYSDDVPAIISRSGPVILRQSAARQVGLILTYEHGWSARRIAEKLDVWPRTVTRWRSKERALS